MSGKSKEVDDENHEHLMLLRLPEKYAKVCTARMPSIIQTDSCFYVTFQISIIPPLLLDQNTTFRLYIKQLIRVI